MITIDLEAGSVSVDEPSGRRVYALSTAEGFAAVSRAWLRAGWDAKHVYTFTWLGRPVIQLPEDLMRIQELIFTVAPDVIVETGIAHGGSCIFYASLCRLLGRGRVVAVDVEIRPHNRAAIEAHPLASLITMIEGDSTDPAVVDRVRSEVPAGATVLVLLDSCHTKQHVLAELEAYGPLVSPGSYIVAMDGIMADVAGAPRTSPDWTWNNPTEAATEYLARHREFVRDDPPFLFDESNGARRLTYCPGGFLRRLPGPIP